MSATHSSPSEGNTASITSERKATQQSISANLRIKLAIGAGALILAFLLGYVPSSISSRNARAQNAELQHRLMFAELGGQLAMASYEANRNNYADAAQYSNQFFDGLPRVITDTRDGTVKQQLQSMLARRAEIASNPEQVDPTVKEKLAAMYAEYFQVTRSVNKSGQ
jgi:hypothetical protein